MKKLFILALLPVFCSVAYADDNLNQRTGLQPEVQTKVNNVIAKTYIQGQSTLSQTNQSLDDNQGNQNSQNRQSNNKSDNQKSIGSVQTINNFENVRQAPKEVITAVRGDIINICFHCR